MSRNDITGDSIYTKDSRKYEENWERVFGKKRKKCVECGDEIEAWELHEACGEYFHKRCWEFIDEDGY